MDINETINKQFLNVSMRPSAMFYQVQRTLIHRKLAEHLPRFHGDVLDVGCGIMPYRQMIESTPGVDRYVGMDLENPTYYGHVEPDITWDGTTIPLGAASVDCVIATEFLEHYADVDAILGEIGRVLKPGGTFLATVPFLWNLHEVPFDEYRYTPYSLRRVLEKADFRNIEIEAIGGWNASLAQMIGLWVRFSHSSPLFRRLASYALLPVYALLAKTDRPPKTFDGEVNSMFNGLCAIATK